MPPKVPGIYTGAGSEKPLQNLPGAHLQHPPGIWYSGNKYSAWDGHAARIAAAGQQVSLLNNLLRVSAPPWFVPQEFDNGKIESVAGRVELIFCGLVYREFEVQSLKSGASTSKM